ncbi:MAG: radical SAM protein [Spirochaetia bacterium]|nr:radical SAM protein [Spirochaetia bacterium]
MSWYNLAGQSGVKYNLRLLFVYKGLGVDKLKVRKEIDLCKRYNVPENISVRSCDGVYLVVAREYANWIVLENEQQLQFFELLQSYSLGEALEVFSGEKKDAVAVVTQLEAKRFEAANIKPLGGDQPSIFIYLTSECNMQCPHCYMYAGKKKEGELSFHEIKTILAEYKKYGGKTVCFSGGEICMRPDIIQIVQEASRLEYKIKLMTNGTLWTPELIATVAPLVDSVQISIDGYDEEENARIRGRGNFQKALDAVDGFFAKGTKVSVAITPLYDEELEQKAQKFGAFGRSLLEKYGQDNFTLLFSTNLLAGREISVSKEENKKYEKIVTEIIYPLCYGEMTEEKKFIDFNKLSNRMNLCAYGNPYISSTGDVAFCSELVYTHPVANIRKDGFAKILELREKARRLADVDNLMPCRECELKYICGGGCRTAFFEELIQCDVGSTDEGTHFERVCTQQDKEHFYRLMIQTNSEFFR